MSTPTNLAISCVQFSDTDYSVLKVAVNLLIKNKTSVKLLDKGDMKGDIIAVDIDAPEGKNFYSQFDYANKCTLLLVSSDMVHDQRNLVLRKPLRVQTLKDIIFEMISDMAPKLATARTVDETLREIEEPREEPRFAPTVDMKKTLFYSLLHARNTRQTMQIYTPPHPALYIDPMQGIIATSASREVLRKITHGRAAVVSKALTQADFDILARGQQIIPLSHILWAAGLYGSAGQLLEGHSLETPVQLIAWPNFSRLEFEPEHMRLTPLMTLRPTSLKDIKEKTGFSWDVIINFYNAAWATNLISIKPVTNKVVKAAKEPQKQSLFNKIAHRLKIAS
jgi:hypothetical protein